MIKKKTFNFFLKKYFRINIYYPVKKINNKKVIFIHIPKTGGTSISKSFGFTHWAHLDVKQVKNKVKSDWDESFKFTFVRNPYERALSLYQEFIKHNKKLKPKIQKELSFEKWLTLYYQDRNEKYILSKFFLKTQKEWLVNDMGIIDLDYLGRLEDIEKDFYYLSNFIGIKFRLQKYNRGFLNSKYVSCRSNKTDEIIENYFKEDFEAFNYSFGNF